METVETTLDQKQYPNESLMNLFLTIGEKMDIFKTILMDTKSENPQNRYRSINAIRCLSVCTEYLSQPGNEKDKELFLTDMNKVPKERIYLAMAEMILKIWGEKNQNRYTKQTIELYKNSIAGRQEIGVDELPIIPKSILPDRGIDNSGKILIHQIFQEKIAADMRIKEQADTIQQDTNIHMLISRPVNTEGIDNLKKKLLD